MRIVVIADIHGFQQQLAITAGDVLVVAGDICPAGTLEDVSEFGCWLRAQPCRHKIVVAGNHDAPFEHEPETALHLLTGGDPGIIYLQDSSARIDDVLFYGSPWTPTFMNWCFMADRGASIRQKWLLIPEQTDVLVTHGPPLSILDEAGGLPWGCLDLQETVFRLRPKFHLFGHIHEAYGMTFKKNTTFVNASICNGSFRAVNKPIIVDM